MQATVVYPVGNLDRVEKAINDQTVTLERIVITHSHIDHAGRAAELAERNGVPIEGPQQEDAFWTNKLATLRAEFGLTGARDFTTDRWLEGSDEIRFAMDCGRLATRGAAIHWSAIL